MGLTRPRAAQIYDIDYKQAVRVITTSNITLSGGAPLVVDGVTLSLNDRILVAGQSTASQNGIYKVTVTGTGSNGTWARTSDNDATGELLSGTIVMVTEGTTYADTSWKLTTNNPITIGTTALTFEINTGNAFGVISANGTSVVANSATGTVTFSTGNNIVITGNATTDTITFAVKDSPTFYGSVLPGANITYDLGTTTSRWRDIYLANSTIYLGNAQISANSTAVIITNPAGGTTVLSGASPAVDANTVTATGNITGGNLITGGILSVTGNANVGNLGTTGIITVTGNVTANNFVGNLTGIANTANWLYIVESPDDNVTYNLPYIGTTGVANGYRQLYSDDTALTFNPSTNLLTVASATHSTAMSSPNVATTTTTGTTSLFTTITSGTLNIMTGQTSGPLTVGGTAATGAINIGRSTASQTIAIGNGVTASGSTKTIDIGTLGAANSITNINIGPVAGNSTVSFLANARVTIANALSVTGNANVGNLGATNANLTAITATGNANVGNLGTAGQITATGNITSGNVNLSGNIVDTGALFLITGASGNVTLSPNGTDVVIATTTGANITGTLNATGNANVGNLGATNANLTAITVSGNANVGNLGTTAIVATGAISGSTTLSVTGNANVGNLGTAGLVVATGNVNAGGFSTAGNITGAYFLGNVACASGIFTTKIFNGTSEANIGTSGGNANITIGGVSNVAVFSTAGANISGTLGVTGNITGGNLSGTLLTGTLATAAQPNVTSVGTLTSLTASGNVTGGNLVTTGTVSTGTLSTSGNATIAGNLTVSGNVISVNVTDLNVVDPIIGIGRGANNTPLTTNDGKDRGEQLWYYTTSEQSAFIGYDNSAGKLIAATNVSISSEVVTVNSYGNLIVGGLEATTISSTGNANVGNLGTAGQITATGNVTAGGISTAGNVTAAFFLGNVSQASGIFTTKIFNGTSEANIGASGGNLAVSIGGTSNVVVVATTGIAVTGTSTVSGNANVGNLGTAGLIVATGNITGGNLITAGLGSIGTTLSVTGNANVGNLGTAGQITATGNVSANNFNVTGNIVDTGALFLITGASGNVTLAPNGTNVVIATTTGANVTGTLNATGNANVGNLGATNAVLAGSLTGVTTISASGNANVGNIGATNAVLAGTLTGVTTISASGNANVGNIGATNAVLAGSLTGVTTISASGNANVGNLGATNANIIAITATGNANVGNLGTAGQITATGNVTGGNLNVSGNIVDTGALFLITGASGNVTLAPNGTNVVIATTTGANVTGTLNATGNANVGNLGTAGQITATGNITGGNILGNGFNLTGINTFSSIAVTGANTVTADSIADTLTLVAGTGITIVTNDTTDTITIATSSSGSEIFVDGADFGTVAEAVTLSQDLGLITVAVDAQSDLGEIVISGVFYPTQLVLPTYTVSTLPSATIPAQFIYVSNESGGAVPAFSDGTNWRRVTDRAIVS